MTAARADDDLPRRIDLGGATLLIPERFRPEAGCFDLVLHLHGEISTIERALATSRWTPAVIVFNRPGLSSAYARPFSDPDLFPTLLRRAGEAVSQGLGIPPPEPGRVIVSAFSAGFGGVRELLNQPEAFERIDALILADSLYCGYRDENRALGLDPAKMMGFRRFAAEAAAGRKAMLVTHSSQVPEGYASTTETADDLIRSVDARAVEQPEAEQGGWPPSRRLATGRFLVLGFDGASGEDHLRHLRELGRIWRELPDTINDRVRSGPVPLPQDARPADGPPKDPGL